MFLKFNIGIHKLCTSSCNWTAFNLSVCSFHKKKYIKENNEDVFRLYLKVKCIFEQNKLFHIVRIVQKMYYIFHEKWKVFEKVILSVGMHDFYFNFTTGNFKGVFMDVWKLECYPFYSIKQT